MEQLILKHIARSLLTVSYLCPQNTQDSLLKLSFQVLGISIKPPQINVLCFRANFIIDFS